MSDAPGAGGGAWARAPRVPWLEPARACAWVAVAAAVGLWTRAPEAPALWQASVSAGGCELVEGGAEPACPCGELPARLRGVLGLPLPLNRASAGELELLPGIGARRAAAIVQERERRGSFDEIADLEAVHGIGPRTVRDLAPRLFTHRDPACDGSPIFIRSGARPPD